MTLEEEIVWAKLKGSSSLTILKLLRMDNPKHRELYAKHIRQMTTGIKYVK